MDSKQHFSLWYFIVAMLLLSALQSRLSSRQIETLAYSDVKAPMQADKVHYQCVADGKWSSALERYRRLDGRIPKGAPIAGAARVFDLFSQAEQLQPCIIFIDELDALDKARGIGALGHTQQQPTEHRHLLKRSELLDRLDVLLGGRGTELLVFGEPSTGVQNDLQRASDLARHLVSQYGMGDMIGAATFATRPASMLPGEPGVGRPHEYSKLTAQRTLLESPAKLLPQHETVDCGMLKQLVAGRQPAPVTTDAAA